jgi:protein-S-isoprenylcysteine O-methyltransferase Ste14
MTRVPLLSKMEADLTEHGRLRIPTAAAMSATYATHSAITAIALRDRTVQLRLNPTAASIVGDLLAASGTVLCLAGMRKFTGSSELTGTSNEALVTTGVYRHSRNPQYLGYVLTLTGLALARRSGLALAMTGLLALTYARWIPIEEEHLADTLGQPYNAYRRATRRWWGRR